MKHRQLRRATALLGTALALSLALRFGFGVGAHGVEASQEGKTSGGRWTGQPDPQVKGKPGETVVDFFHPANQSSGDGVPEMPQARRGGRVIVHLAEMPKHLNYMTENSAVARWIMHAVHDYLLFRDWVTWELKPVLAKGWTREDALVLAGGEGWNRERVRYGKVTEEGDDYVVEPLSRANPLGEEQRIPKQDVASLQRGTVFTFELRDDVKWHDGHPFDAHDVYFSWQCYHNPKVDCEAGRAQLSKIVDAEVLDEHTIRFFYAQQDFLATENFDALQIVPSHVYNLADPDNPKHKAGVDPLGPEQALFVNQNSANVNWVGLGPYRITEVTDQYVEARRTQDYFDAETAGYVDVIRWRHIANDDAAKQAVLEGELDYFGRLRSEDYFGDFCQTPTFTERFYKGYYYRPTMNYWAWNLRRPLFQDARVRTALAHAMDWDEFLRTHANGLGVRTTATWPYLSKNYDHTLEPIPFDLARAQELLDEAGWYDRDGDEVRDKNGQPFRFEYLMTPGNKAAEIPALKFQENLGKIGVQMDIATRDWAGLQQRCKEKDFDATSMAWILDPENSPRQLWHSYQGPAGEDRGSNYPGVADAEIDRLIAEIEVELDADARAKLFHRLQRRIHELQPYMFSYNTPVKYAMAKRVRNFRQYGLNPGYSLRDWFLVEE